MLQLNYQFLNEIPSLFGDRIIDFCDKVWGPKRLHLFHQNRAKNWRNITCQQLVKICNIYHIPLNAVLQEKPVSYTSAEQVKFIGNWKDITYTPQNVYNMYTDKSNRVQQRDFAKAIGVTSSCIYRWFNINNECLMTVQQAMLMTFRMKLGVDFLFSDPNSALPQHANVSLDDDEDRYVLDLQNMKEIIRKQQSEIARLTSRNKELNDMMPDSFVAEPVAKYKNVRPWRFNTALWNNLHTVLGISRRELQRKTASRLMMEDPTIHLLVSICNTIDISIKHFILRSYDEPTIQAREYYKEERFTPVTFLPGRLNDIFCIGNILGKSRKEVLDIIGVTDTESRRWTAPTSHITVNELVNACNRLDITPAVCIHDPNANTYVPTLTELLIHENIVLKQQLMRRK